MSDSSSIPGARPCEPWVDWAKAIAAQCIVWHHLVHYGPLAPRVRAWAPQLVQWLDQRALLAVQVFLVIGGYLAARSLWPRPGVPRVAAGDWLVRVGQRWRRLAPPYLAAVGLAVAAAALARWGMDDADTPAAPTLAQLAANLTLTHDLVGEPALSAGLWYVAIDLQLYALLAALAAALAWLWPAAPAAADAAPVSTRRRLVGGVRRPVPTAAPRGRSALGLALLACAALAALTVFNRQPDADAWAPYFFGSYALGVLAAWGATRARPWRWALLIAALAAIGLAVEWRDRLALAALMALLLLVQPARAWLAGHRLQPLMAWLARLSYALFLVHYPVSLLVNTAVERWLPPTPAVAAAGLIATWAASLGVAWLTWRLLEKPAARALPSPRAEPIFTRTKEAT